MGKIRVKTLGLEEEEKKQAEKAKARREAKKALKDDKEPQEVKEVVAPKKNKEVKEEQPQEVVEEQKPAVANVKAPKTEDRGAKAGKGKEVKVRGKKYQKAKKTLDAERTYSLKDGLSMLRKMKYASFDETVELHFNLKEAGVKGEAQLPHGTGKEVRVAIVNDALLKNVEAGTIDFDVLIAAPQDMPKLVKFAKVLGPRGLMPSPKAGTVSDKPEEAAKKFKGGAVRFKSEAKFPLLHQSVGKMSFKDEELSKNIQALISAVQTKNIDAVFLKSTMSPSIRIQID